MKKAISLLVAAGLVLVGVPGGAEVFGPNTVWGVAPARASSAANAVLLDVTGKVVATVPVVDGQFAFRDVAPGQYSVMLQTATGQELARSFPVAISAGAEEQAYFDRDQPAAVVPTGGGLGTTGWILIGAGAVGIATVIWFATSEEEGVASPSR